MIRDRLLTTGDADSWRAILPADASVMGSVEYARICEKRTGYPARLFVLETDGPAVAYPFFLRPISTLPFEAGLGKEAWDTCTPEYTGPLSPARLAAFDGLEFADRFARVCREHRIVAEFAHLNPWNVPAGLLDPASVEFDREIVYVDLTGSEEQVWARSLTSDGRRQTKQARRAGVRVRRAESPGDILEFHRLHTLTMKRCRALDRYYFPPEHFLEIQESMPENAFYVLAEYRDRVVAAGLFFVDRSDVYWHLSAADLEFASVRPVNAFVYETIRWAVSRRKQHLVMGGGCHPNDGVFHFKANFSPLRAWFRTFKRVHDATAYAALTRAWTVHYGGCPPRFDFFPAYRSASPGESSAPKFPSAVPDSDRVAPARSHRPPSDPA
ncbi:MAG: GNAT family N-acetyltransferase [Planctomycetes bacterium]|nr:GNAT family N-acetyltransferase [Planctomycetota bacterium]